MMLIVFSEMFVVDFIPVIYKGWLETLNVQGHIKEFVTSYDQIWISWAMSMRRCFCSKFNNFETIFAAARFIPKTSVIIAWHDPNDMPTASATSLTVIRRLSKIIFLLL